jgi:hypothetical protein
MVQLLVLFLCIAAKETPSKRRLSKAMARTQQLLFVFFFLKNKTTCLYARVMCALDTILNVGLSSKQFYNEMQKKQLIKQTAQAGIFLKKKNQLL